MYKLIGLLSNMEIAEMCARSGANCGSLFLDLRFRELVKTLLADHPAHLDGTLVLLSLDLLLAFESVKLGSVMHLIPDIGSRFAGVLHAQLFGDDQDGVPRRG